MGRKLLQNVRLIDAVANVDQVNHVLMDNGCIVAIAPENSSDFSQVGGDVEIINATGMVLGTGLIDLYSYSGEPGKPTRETIGSLMRAAAAGGFTQVCILPDTDPAIDNPGILAQVLQAAARESLQTEMVLPCVQVWGAITNDIAGESMIEFADLAANVIGFSDAKPLTNLGMVRKFLEYTQPLAKPVALWACDPQLRGDGIMREGVEAVKFGLPLTPTSAESAAIAALIEVVRNTGTPVHFMRVSTERGVELIAAAKEENLPITASTTWMHVLNTTSDVESYDPSLRLEPPLGGSGDRAALRDGIRAGVIDAIAIDHSPYTYEEKTVAFAIAPPGAIGLEIALPLLWQHLVATNEFTALELWRALSLNPARCIQQNTLEITPGNTQDLTLFDTQQTWLVNEQNLHSLSQNTPWYGREITGKALQIFCN